MPTSTTFLFAGGGTGGHIYPALAIADEIAALDPSARCVVACSDRPLDRSILEGEGRAFEVIPAKPLSLRPRGLIRFLRSWGPSVRAGRRIISDARARGPIVVVAMGGFVAAPVVQAARAQGVPLALVNLDAVPGKANRWIARRVRTIWAVAGGPNLPNWTTIPPIVRRAARVTDSPQACRAALGLDPESRTLLVTGGSQGAGSVNDFLRAFLEHHAADLAGWQVLHQCGDKGEAELQRAYDDARVPARVTRFVRAMGQAWGAADLAVARSGAGAVAEVWANSVPALFLPYPYHRDQHQKRNAAPLVNAGGAAIVDDLVNPGDNLANAGPILRSLLTDAARLNAMRTALGALGPADGAARVAQGLLQISRR